MRRREFIAGLLLTATIRHAQAQLPERARRIGVLMATAPDAVQEPLVIAFKQALAELGWSEGRNIRVDVRWAAAQSDKMRVLAKELINLQPDVIVCETTPGTTALQQETRTIPIVFVNVADPVGSGFVTSLAQPGSNITGFTNIMPLTSEKWLELLKEINPDLSRVLVITYTRQPTGIVRIRALEPAASLFKVQLIAGTVRNDSEIEPTIDAFAREANGGIIVLPSPFATVYRDVIIAGAIKHRLPAVYPYSYYAKSGGLMSYGVDMVELFQRAASYADRILKGAKPGDLPVQEPTKFELVINLKAARALGLNVPDSLLVRADEVIE